MTSFREQLLATVVQPLMPLLSVPPGFDVHTSRVIVRSGTWSGGEVGIGTVTVTDLEITPRPKVRDQGNQVLHVTLIIPTNANGGYTWAQLKPADATAFEYYYVIIGPDGVERAYSLRDIDTREPFFYGLFLEPLDRKVPF